VRRRTLAGYLRTLNYRSHPVTDIKPDTSLYTDLPSRLRAMALVLEGPRERRQHAWKGTARQPWNEISSSWDDPGRVQGVARMSNDYRLKPAPPAKLHVYVTDDGQVAYNHAWSDKMPAPPMPGTTRVTYVLENPDAND
jgi:hypothetical protein